jgi:hypothetical protein
MNTFFKAAGLVLVFVLAAVGLLVYLFFNGNPVSARSAQQEMEQYLAQTYPGKEFSIKTVDYNFKFGRYEARVTEGQSNTFLLAATAQGVQYDEYKYTYAMDAVLTERFSQALKNELQALWSPTIPSLRAVEADFYVAKDLYPADTQYSRGMETQARLEIYLVGNEIPESMFAAQCARMRDEMLQAGYRPQSMYILYNQPEDYEGKGGMLLYTLKIEESGFTEPASVLQSGVQHYNQQHRGR